MNQIEIAGAAEVGLVLILVIFTEKGGAEPRTMPGFKGGDHRGQDIGFPRLCADLQRCGPGILRGGSAVSARRAGLARPVYGRSSRNPTFADARLPLADHHGATADIDQRAKGDTGADRGMPGAPGGDADAFFQRNRLQFGIRYCRRHHHIQRDATRAGRRRGARGKGRLSAHADPDQRVQNGAVDPISDQSGIGAVEAILLQLGPHIRTFLFKAAERLRDDLHAGADQTADADRGADRVAQELQLLDTGFDLAVGNGGFLQDALAVFGQRDMAGGAGERPRARYLLEMVDRLWPRRLRDARLARSINEGPEKSTYDTTVSC